MKRFATGGLVALGLLCVFSATVGFISEGISTEHAVILGCVFLIGGIVNHAYPRMDT